MISRRSPAASPDKLIRRHPHVFGTLRVKDVDQVWANWEKIKRAEKHGTRHARASALDGIPKRLPALLQAEKLVKKAHKAKLLASTPAGRSAQRRNWRNGSSPWPNSRKRRGGQRRTCCAARSNAASAPSAPRRSARPSRPPKRRKPATPLPSGHESGRLSRLQVGAPPAKAGKYRSNRGR